MGFFGKGTIVVIDIEFIPSVAVAHVARVADVDIQPAVIVDIDEYDAGAPHAVLPESGFGGSILEVKISFVEIDLIIAHIGGEHDVGKAVVIQIADGYAAAVVKIAKEKAVFQFVVDYFVIEIDAGVVHQFEKSRWLFVSAGGAKHCHQQNRDTAKQFRSFH